MANRMTQKQFVDRSNIVHNTKYDYSLIDYKNTYTKVKIICHTHGVFEQRPNGHLHNQGCPKCYVSNKNKTTEQFIKEASKLHSNYYDYSLVKYINSKTKVKIICKTHGVFEQRPDIHLCGYGCLKCSINIKTNTLKQFIEDANKIHNTKYDYSLVDYKNNQTNIKIICKTHGVFEQTPNNHLAGNNCPRCYSSISKQETLWLDSLNVPIRNKIIKLSNGTIIKPDGYDPITNTIYEYYGDYWHGNPNKYNSNDINKHNKKTFGELYEETLQREKLIKEDGYNLIVIWENNFDFVTKNCDNKIGN
jgi:hypothetical protein